MAEIATYPDALHYKTASKSKSRPKSNLCTKYLSEKGKFCGNYCTNKSKYQDRCWLHRRWHIRKAKDQLCIQQKVRRPRIVIVMITTNGSIFNKSRWLNFLSQCEEYDIPITLAIYADEMYKTTVRHPWNFISRFRPIPSMYRSRPDISLINSHGGMSYVNVVMNMLEYVSGMEDVQSCILVTERTIPIHSAKTIYKSAISYKEKCVIDPDYNVRWSSIKPPTLPHRRGGKDFEIVNNRGQGLLSVKFLKEALPTLAPYCDRFGLIWNKKEKMYKVNNEDLFNTWIEYAGGFPDEFWLLNSYLFHLADAAVEPNPLRKLHQYMLHPNTDDKLIITEVAERPGLVKRSIVFKTMDKIVTVKVADKIDSIYYRGLKGNDEKNKTITTNLQSLIRFLRKHRKRCLFFRNVELESPLTRMM